MTPFAFCSKALPPNGTNAFSMLAMIPSRHAVTWLFPPGAGGGVVRNGTQSHVCLWPLPLKMLFPVGRFQEEDVCVCRSSEGQSSGHFLIHPNLTCPLSDHTPQWPRPLQLLWRPLFCFFATARGVVVRCMLALSSSETRQVILRLTPPSPAAASTLSVLLTPPPSSPVQMNLTVSVRCLWIFSVFLILF